MRTMRRIWEAASTITLALLSLPRVQGRIRRRIHVYACFSHTTTSSRTRSLNDSMLYQNTNKERVRFRGRVAYDGTGYNGWQAQSKGRTVQGELEAVLSRRFDRHVRIVGAGRTDAGVHARGQAFHFELFAGEIDTREDELKLQRSMNAMLGRDTRVWNVVKAPSDVEKVRDDGSKIVHKWNVMFEATSKLYSYRICTAPALNPIQRFTRCHVFEPINIDKLKSALKHFEGTHDFRAFAGAIEQNERKRTGKYAGTPMGTVRTVYKVDLIDEKDGNYKVDFMLKGALYKMIRNMMGTALEVSKGRMDEQALIDLLNRTGDDVRSDNRCKPAPPEGLTLERVFFDDDF